MTITKDVLKAEIDRVEDRYLEVLYRIIKALEGKSQVEFAVGEWQQFLEATYGSTQNAPIERESQGIYEIRDSLK